MDKNGRSFAPRIGQRAAYRGNHSSYIFAFLGFVLFCFVLAALQHMEFMGQGSDLSHSCDLYRSYSNARSFSPLCRPGIKPASWQRPCGSCWATVETPAFLLVTDSHLPRLSKGSFFQNTKHLGNDSEVARRASTLSISAYPIFNKNQPLKVWARELSPRSKFSFQGGVH